MLSEVAEGMRLLQIGPTRRRESMNALEQAEWIARMNDGRFARYAEAEAEIARDSDLRALHSER